MSKRNFSKDDHLLALDDLDKERTPFLRVDLSLVIEDVFKDPFYVRCFEDKDNRDLYFRGVHYFSKKSHPHNKIIYHDKESKSLKEYTFGMDVWLADPIQLLEYDTMTKTVLTIPKLDHLLNHRKLLRDVTAGRPQKQMVAEYVW